MKQNVQNNSFRLMATVCMFLVMLLASKGSYAQLTGSISIPTSSYPTIKVAVDSLNLYGVGTGGVIFNVASLSTETAPVGGIKLTATGTLANPVIIRKDPASTGANPVITSYVGTSTTIDGVFFLLGSDYVTIDGIDIVESAANITATTQMEWGYALLNRNATAPFNGCNNNTIKNSSITLNRTNTASKGIYLSHHTATSTAALTLTAVGDDNSNNKFYANKIQNVWVGIYMAGFDDATFTFRDVNNDVGGNSYATADTITGLGIGVASAATGSHGVSMLNQMNPNVSYNYIDNALGGVPATLTVAGIYALGSSGGYQSLNNHVTITHNSIYMTQGANGVSYCANVQNYDGNITITYNDIKLLATLTGTGTQYGVFTTHASNPIGTATYSLKYNTAQNFSINNSSGLVYLFSTGSINQAIQDISYNVINNITRINATTGSLYGFYTGVSSLGIVIPGSTTNVYNNSITNITLSNTSTGGVFQVINSAGNLTCNYYNNIINNISCPSITGSVAVVGLYQNGGGDISIYDNTISAINATRDLSAIYTAQGSKSLSIYNNKTFALTSAGVGNILCGINMFNVGSNFSKVYNNKIYGLTESASGICTAQGITVNNGASGVTAVYVPVYIYNNTIGNIKAPLSSAIATPGVMGINVGSTNTNPFNAYIRYNNIYLNDTAGANSHSAAIFHNYIASRLYLNNNLLVNNTYHAAGTGIACGIMRSGAVLTTYDATSGNNFIYAGVPSSRNVIHFDGINKDSVFNSFKVRVAPREMTSFTQNITMFNAGSTPPVVSTSANYLQNDTTVISLVESGAANIAGITTDIRGVIRQGNPGYVGTGSKPDIGAFESQGTTINMTYDSLIVTKDNSNALVNYNNQQVANIQVYVSGSTNSLSATSFTLNTSGSTNVANMSKAKLFYCGTSSALSTATPFGAVVTSPNGTFTFTGSQPLVNGANNFWLVYDIAPTATVGHIVDVLVTNVVVGGITKTPLNGNPAGTKTIAAQLNGAYTIGTAPYLTLAAMVNALNSNGVSGNVTVNIPAAFTETAPVGGYVLGSTMLNSTLSVNRKLTFQKAGAGINPLLTAATGVSATLDGIFTMQGTDYVTIDGIDLVDLNTVSATTQMEWGYGLLKGNTIAPYDGCQNVVIKNSVITLNIGNTASKGIYGNNHTATDATMLVLADISETNSNNAFLGNTIQNVNTGISFMGYSISAQLANTTLYDQNNIIGDSASGNTIINFGGITAGFGINVYNQSNAKINYNTVDNANGGIASSALQTGIQHNYIYTSGPNTNNVTLSNNDVTLTILQSATIGMQNIFVQNTHGNVVMNNNNIKWVTAGTGANGGPYLGITFNTLGASYLANSLSFKGNTAKNFSFISGGTGAHIVFNIAGSALTEDLGFDSIFNISRIPGTAASTANLTLFYNYTGSNPGVSTMPALVRNIHDNYIVNVNNGSTSTGGITIMNIGSTYNLNAYNNRISSVINGAAGNTVYGIFVSGTMQNCAIYNNTIDTLTGGTGSTYGINFSNATGISAAITNNSISNISATGATASLASGIYLISGGRNVSVYSNKIYNIATAATGAAYASGIYYNNVGTAAYNLSPAKFYNNLISGIAAPAATNNPAVVGITVGFLSTSSYPFAQLYNNTISLTGTTANNINSAGIYTVNVLNGMMKLSNNIVLNNINPTGTGAATALFRNGVSLGAFDATSGNNIYWAGTPSVTHLIYYDGVNKDQTMLAYKSRVYPRENGSVSENTTMISTTGTDPYYLYPDSTIGGSVSNGGTAISGIATDFKNTTRSLTTPDIGAYEGNFTLSDVTAPSIITTALPNSGVSATIGFTATIKDVSGIAGIPSGNGPRVFFKKTGGAYVTDLGTLASGTLTNGVWSFTMNASSLGGWIVGDTVFYYVAAQDLLSNVGSAPFGAAGASVVGITTDPTPYKFVITNGLSGTYTLCASGCNFTSLSNTYGAFDSINKSAVTGNVTLSIAGDLLNETGAVGLNDIAQPGNFKISIVPNSATERLIVGSVGSAAGIINLNGADNVTIDGRFAGSGKYLRIRNRNVGGCTVKLMNDAHLDTIRYVNIEGNTSAVGTVYFNTPSATGTGNDSNAVMFCDIRDTLGNGIDPSPGVFAVQNTCFYSDGNMNSANTIASNNFYNYIYQGINFASNLSAHDNWVINQNSFYQLPAVQAKSNNTGVGSATQAIYLGSGQGHTITNNSIGGSAPDRSGLPSKGLYINSGYAISYYGIVLLTNLGLDQTTTISGNKISNIDANPLQGYNQFAGITVQSGNVNITGNTIGGGALPYDTIKEGSYSNSNVGGIVIAGGIVSASVNTVGNISNYLPNNSPGLTNIRTVGINIVGGSTAPYIFSVLSNTVRDIKSNYNYVASSGFQHYLNPQGTSPVGILVTAGTGVAANIDGNTIYNITNTSTLGATNQANGITIKGGVCTVQRNRIYNINALSIGTGADASALYGIYVNATSPLGQVVRNNQVSLIPSATNTSTVFGIVDGSIATVTSTITHNSVYIGGTATGSNNSYALLAGAPASYTTINIINNLLHNGRTGGTGSHIATGAYFTPAAINAPTFGYNLMVSALANTLMEVPAGTLMNAAAINTMYPTASSNSNWMETSANVPAAGLFTNTATGDLSLNAANAASWYANGKGLPMASVLNDYNNAARSTTIAGGSVDIGSAEVTPSVAPASATASAAPALNSTTTYTFGNRTVASVTWGATGTVPTSLDVKYYTGTNAPLLAVGKTQYNAYYAVTPTGGTGYTYNMALSYDSAVMGNVGTTAASRMAYYKSPVWSWLTTSSANGATGMLTSGAAMAATTLPANFTGTNVSNPLPVRLVKFVATAVAGDVQLGWTTATETNNKGFEVERSVDGELFEQIGFVKGAGNSNRMLSYGLNDRAAFANANSNSLYYRLKQVDMDGAFSYSDAINVTTEMTETMNVGLYPNPATDVFNVSAMAATEGMMIVTITDIQGKAVSSYSKETAAGMNTLSIDGSTLNGAGIYFVKVTMDGESKVVKLIKQ